MTLREKYAQRLAAGLCSHCGKRKLVTKTLCQKCREQLRSRAERRARKHTRIGLCRCGNKPTSGFKSCNGCRNASKHCYTQLKDEVYRAYGGAICRCCDVTEPAFLTIDHVNGDGNKHRRQVGVGWYFLQWLKKNNFPAGFQILCHNCQWGKRTYGVCPHQKR